MDMIGVAGGRDLPGRVTSRGVREEALTSSTVSLQAAIAPIAKLQQWAIFGV